MGKRTVEPNGWSWVIIIKHQMRITMRMLMMMMMMNMYFVLWATVTQICFCPKAYPAAATASTWCLRVYIVGIQQTKTLADIIHFIMPGPVFQSVIKVLLETGLIEDWTFCNTVQAEGVILVILSTWISFPRTEKSSMGCLSYGKVPFSTSSIKSILNLPLFSSSMMSQLVFQSHASNSYSSFEVR